MKIKKLNNGTLLVPKRVESDGIIGDGILEVKPNHKEYAEYLKQYTREQNLDWD